MGRAELRRKQRQELLDYRKGKIMLSKQDLNTIRDEESTRVSNFSVEALMTCFALAEHRVYKFGTKRALRTLKYVDELMADITNETKTIDDYKKILEDEIHLKISCSK